MSQSSAQSHRTTVYGPVRSWRFGMSLGVDPILDISTCSFNCIYCQLGNIQRITTERREFITSGQLAEDLQNVDWANVDVVTFSGSGEPTLAANLDRLITVVREHCDKPILILTNATLFNRPEVRRQAALADMLSCKLDAPDDLTLNRINRPAEGVTLESIVTGIEKMRAEFDGKLMLQIMFMPANVREVERWVPLIKRISPDEVHLNTPKRPYPLAWYLESRGDHESRHRPEEIQTRQLKVVTQEEARQAERILREQTGVQMVSVYHE